MTEIELVRLNIGLNHPENIFYELISDENIEFLLGMKGATVDSVTFRIANNVLMQLAMMPTREKNGDVEVWGEFAKYYKDALNQMLISRSRSIDLAGLQPYLSGMSRSRLCENMNNPEVVKSPLVTTGKPINVCGDEDCYAGNNCK